MIWIFFCNKVIEPETRDWLVVIFFFLNKKKFFYTKKSHKFKFSQKFTQIHRHLQYYLQNIYTYKETAIQKNHA